MMHGVWQDIRYAVRSLVKAPGFAVVVVLILAIGIGANVAMFSIMETAMLRSLPYGEPDRLVLGRTTFDGNINWTSSAPDYWDWRDLSTSFEYLGASWGFTRNHTITGGEETEQVPGVTVSVEFFPALGVVPQVGRGFAPDESLEGGPNVAIISHGYWQRRFGGSPDAVGGTLTVDGFPHEVIGVMPAGFRFYYDVDVWRPMRPDSDFIGARRFHNWLLIGRLNHGVTLAQAQSEVDVVSAQLEAEYPDSNEGKALLLTPLQDAMVEGYRQSVLMLMTAVALVLLIACGNVAGLLLARGSAKRVELSVRAALGASGARLVRQLLTESLVMAVVGGIVGTLLAAWLQPFFLQLMAVDIPSGANVGFPMSVLLFAIAVSVATGVLAGTVPALRVSRSDLHEELKSGVRSTDAGGTRFRSGLVIVQVALSVVLLIGAGLLIRSLASLMGTEPGFDARNLLTAEIRLPSTEYQERERRIQFYTRLVEDLSAVPGVEGVALINQLPIRNPGNNIYVHDEENPPLDPADVRSAYIRAVLPGYFETLGIPLLSGRAIEATDVGEALPVLVISQKMADSIFPGVNPVGRRAVVDFGQPVTFEVVGVVADVKMTSLVGGEFPTMYGSYLQIPYLNMGIAVRTAVTPTSLVGSLRDAVWALNSDIPVADAQTMENVIARTLTSRRVRTVALAIFGGVALLLATVGLYGVLAYYVTRRYHEIGIRVALGARSGDVVRMVLRRGIALVAVGIVIGLAGAFAATRLLEDMLHNVEPADPATFAFASFFFLAVAIIACLLPAWRALRVDPLVALQAE
jgi:predicted permease